MRSIFLEVTMQIRFKNLMLEVTRKCNMQCAHCMRGEQEDSSLSSNTIEKIFSQTSKIKHLTLTGGEPSLEPDVIDWIFITNEFQDIFKQLLSAGCCRQNFIQSRQFCCCGDKVNRCCLYN